MPQTMDPILRRALAATAVMNISGSLVFTPAGAGIRTAFGIPDAHPLWPLSVGSFIFAMGVGYALLARSGRTERTFIAIAALGKAMFGALLVAMAAGGDIPWMAAATGLPDLGFAALFAWRLAATAGDPA
jgi:hypothetical protein